jgi:hypothetical protein
MVVLLAQQTVIVAQTPSAPVPDAWGEVKALQPGDEVTVKLGDGSSVKGKLIYVRDAELALKDGKRDTTLGRESIFQIYQHVPKSRRKSMAIGAAVGGGLGVIGGASSDGAGDLGQPAAAVLGGAVYGGVGALVGWALGGGKKRVLIYQAPR